MDTPAFELGLIRISGAPVDLLQSCRTVAATPKQMRIDSASCWKLVTFDHFFLRCRYPGYHCSGNCYGSPKTLQYCLQLLAGKPQDNELLYLTIQPRLLKAICQKTGYIRLNLQILKVFVPNTDQMYGTLNTKQVILSNGVLGQNL
eukprot:2899524-Rhodomonas_salina.1